jgi:hypothetical protein
MKLLPLGCHWILIILTLDNQIIKQKHNFATTKRCTSMPNDFAEFWVNLLV